jgi:hypothetical protein
VAFSTTLDDVPHELSLQVTTAEPGAHPSNTAMRVSAPLAQVSMVNVPVNGATNLK